MLKYEKEGIIDDEQGLNNDTVSHSKSNRIGISSMLSSMKIHELQNDDKVILSLR